MFLFLFLSFNLYGQNSYKVDISNVQTPIISGHLKLGSNKNPAGEILDANSLYFTKDGKPWYPVMGEIHFTRYPRDKWEESILKMKAAGIDVIASYVFWIYHEEVEGQFNWTGNNDIRAFAELCKKHDIYFFLRIGPWCHGEVRNGGFPDWIVKRGNMRKSNPEYLASVQKFYNEIGKQLKGLYFKDGGLIIGTQIENEYRFNNPAGLEHMLTLKKLAVEAGIDVPFYTATGWPGSDQKQDEIIPVWGAYPEAPWDKKTTKLDLVTNYLFNTLRNDPAIGNDLLGKYEQQSDFKGYRYPYATAEMGGGNQITYHRRPIIVSDDVTALTVAKVGSGANLMGYYMFHGGSNPIGKLSTLQESKATKYPNDYPIISYDFLSPIGEWGQLRPSYRAFKSVHTFLNEFGDRLVQYYPTFPERKPAGVGDNSVLRFAVRSKGNSGFVFISNFQRQLEMKDLDNVQFTLKLTDGSLTFPKTPLTINKNLQAILPFNMDMDGLNLKYATAQPLCRIEGATPLYVFFSPDGVQSEYLLEKNTIATIEITEANLDDVSEAYYISKIKPGTSCVINVTLKNGKKIKILTLSHQQALDSWKTNVFGAEHIFISEQELTFPGNEVKIQSTGNPIMKFSVYPALNKPVAGKIKPSIVVDGIFTAYTYRSPAIKLRVSAKEIKDILPYKNLGKLMPLDERLSDLSTSTSPGPQYQTNLTEVEASKYYEISLPSSVKNLNEAYLKIDYTGDTGSAYINGVLIADDFYSGLPMTIGLKKFITKSGTGKILFQIVPLTDQRNIYFEDGIRDPLKGKQSAELKGVSIVPKYENVISSIK